MSIERIELRPGYSISRIIKGGWHLAGGHGKIDRDQAIEDMRAFVEAGITTFDCADIYTGVEELIGVFLQKYRVDFTNGDLSPIQIHTKYVPDYDALASLTKKDTARIIDRSLARLGVERLDLVQFAWWDYSFPGYVETATHLSELQKAGKIRYIGVTNFDHIRLQEILDAGVEVVSNQLQYSILDHRPEGEMSRIAQQQNIPYLCYGSIAGGFLSDRYLNTQPPSAPLENRSLVKYRLIIDEFGGYELFQEALDVLRKIADTYQVGVAEVAAKYVLQKSTVAGIIVGARNRKHMESLQRIDGFTLSPNDLNQISLITNKAIGPLGPVYDLERDKTGKHGRIMKYNLNEE